MIIAKLVNKPVLLYVWHALCLGVLRGTEEERWPLSEEPFHLLCKTNNTCEESGKTRARYKALTAGATELTNVAGECAKDNGEGVH